MTVSYTAEVATCRGFGCFIPLLYRWRGSVYKLVWMDLIAFLSIYYALSFFYRICLNESQQDIFESIVHYCNSYGTLIPLSFVLGFYVQIVMTRWWDQYMSIPWPDTIAVYVSAHLHGQDERGRLMRRTIMRYVCLCLTMVLCMVSPRVKKRFPTHAHLVEAGLLMENEREVIDHFNEKFPKYPKHWMCIVWASSIATRARKEGRIRDDFSLKTIIDELNNFRGMCGTLLIYDSISIPLVYTQVVTLAVYAYFLCNIIGHQWVSRVDDIGFQNIIDLYFPVFTTMEFFFYMGWLKVAESMINPFGEDDDDFEVNWIIDRNLQVSYLIVDEMHHEHPQLVKDQYWDERFPPELPYANVSEGTREEPPEPSTAKLDLPSTTMTPAIRLDVTPSMAQLNGKATTDHQFNKTQSKVSFFGGVTKRFTSKRIDGDDQDSIVEEILSQLSSPEPEPQSRKPSTTSVRLVRINETTLMPESSEEQEENEVTIIPQAGDDISDVRELFKNTMDLSSSIDMLPAAHIESKDDFERLRMQREKERLERQKRHFVRSTHALIGSPAISQRPSTASIRLSNFYILPEGTAASTEEEHVDEEHVEEEHVDEEYVEETHVEAKEVAQTSTENPKQMDDDQKKD